MDDRAVRAAECLRLHDLVDAGGVVPSCGTDDHGVQDLDAHQLPGALEAGLDGPVFLRWLNLPCGMVVPHNDGGRVAEDGCFEDFPRVDKRALQGAARDDVGVSELVPAVQQECSEVLSVRIADQQVKHLRGLAGRRVLTSNPKCAPWILAPTLNTWLLLVGQPTATLVLNGGLSTSCTGRTRASRSPSFAH